MPVNTIAGVIAALDKALGSTFKSPQGYYQKREQARRDCQRRRKSFDVLREFASAQLSLALAAAARGDIREHDALMAAYVCIYREIRSRCPYISLRDENESFFQSKRNAGLYLLNRKQA